jgi:hypothetical protein
MNGFVTASHVADWGGGNSSDKSTGKAVFCPGPPYGARRARDQIGMIRDYIRLVPAGKPPMPNDTDIALVELEQQTVVVSNNVPRPNEPRESFIAVRTVMKEKDLKAAIGLEVFKCGAGSGFTAGVLSNVAEDKFVLLPDDNEYLMTGCIIVKSKEDRGIFSQPGDSGAVVYDGSGAAVGFIIGGSSEETILHPVEACLDLMDVKPWAPASLRRAI